MILQRRRGAGVTCDRLPQCRAQCGGSSEIGRSHGGRGGQLVGGEPVRQRLGRGEPFACDVCLPVSAERPLVDRVEEVLDQVQTVHNTTISRQRCCEASTPLLRFSGVEHREVHDRTSTRAGRTRGGARRPARTPAWDTVGEALARQRMGRRHRRRGAAPPGRTTGLRPTTGASTKPPSTPCRRGSPRSAERPSTTCASTPSGPGRLPILLANGWPSSFLELTGLAERLSAPSRYGGDPEAAFTVIVPSLPGFGFSPQRPALGGACRPTRSGTGSCTTNSGSSATARTAPTWAPVSELARPAHPEALVGIHLLDVAAPSAYDPAQLTTEERAYLEPKTHGRLPSAATRTSSRPGR